MSDPNTDCPNPLFSYKRKLYPSLVSRGKKTYYIERIAQEFCKGKGIDVGYGDYQLPGAIPIDIKQDTEYHAMNLPAKDGSLDYIFSSHCLEHLPNWVQAIQYWKTKLKPQDGVMFLYLPHYDMEYWRPWNNTKHIHIMDQDKIKDCFTHFGLINTIISNMDLTYSFSAIGFTTWGQ